MHVRIETVRPVERPGSVQPRPRRFHNAARYFQAGFAWPPIGRQDRVDRRIQRALAQIPAMHAGQAKRPLQVPLAAGVSRRLRDRSGRNGRIPGGLAMVAESWAESAPRTPWSVPSARRSASASEASCQVSANVAGRNRAEVPATVPSRRSVPAFCSTMGARIGFASRSMVQRPELSCSRSPSTLTSANGSFSAPSLKLMRPPFTSSRERRAATRLPETRAGLRRGQRRARNRPHGRSVWKRLVRWR